MRETHWYVSEHGNSSVLSHTLTAHLLTVLLIDRGSIFVKQAQVIYSFHYNAQEHYKTFGNRIRIVEKQHSSALLQALICHKQVPEKQKSEGIVSRELPLALRHSYNPNVHLMPFAHMEHLANSLLTNTVLTVMLYLKKTVTFFPPNILTGKLVTTLPVISNHLIISIQKKANQTVLDIKSTLFFNSKSIYSTMMSTFFS